MVSVVVFDHPMLPFTNEIVDDISVLYMYMYMQCQSNVYTKFRDFKLEANLGPNAQNTNIKK